MRYCRYCSHDRNLHFLTTDSTGTKRYYCMNNAMAKGKACSCKFIASMSNMMNVFRKEKDLPPEILKKKLKKKI